MEKKLIIVYENKLDEVNELLNQGWRIDKMSAVCQGALARWICYIYLVKDE